MFCSIGLLFLLAIRGIERIRFYKKVCLMILYQYYYEEYVDSHVCEYTKKATKKTLRNCDRKRKSVSYEKNVIDNITKFDQIKET